MAIELKGRNFLKLEDFTSGEIRGLLDLAKELKAAKYAGNEQPRLRGKNIASISRINALFGKLIEYPRVIEQSLSGALRRGVAVIGRFCQVDAHSATMSA